MSTLVDSFARKHTYLRVSLTERCNQRCIYCMPADGIELTASESQLSEVEYKKIISFFIEEGVDKIRFTGGEPTLSPFQPRQIAHAKEEGIRVGHNVGAFVTTNGLALGVRNGDRVKELVDAGLNGLNVSLDTQKTDRFEALTRRKGHEQVLRCIDRAVDAKLVTKLNCVVMRGKNDDELESFVEFIRPRAVDVRFIEFMPFQRNQWEQRKIVGQAEIQARQKVSYPSLRAVQSSTDARDNIAKMYRVEGVDGRIGVISSVTDNFCSSCNRIRVTANGMIKNCQWSNDEVPVQPVLRGGDGDQRIGQQKQVRTSLETKLKEHAPAEQRSEHSNRPMITIGG